MLVGVWWFENLSIVGQNSVWKYRMFLLMKWYCLVFELGWIYVLKLMLLCLYRFLKFVQQLIGVLSYMQKYLLGVFGILKLKYGVLCEMFQLVSLVLFVLLSYLCILLVVLGCVRLFIYLCKNDLQCGLDRWKKQCFEVLCIGVVLDMIEYGFSSLVGRQVELYILQLLLYWFFVWYFGYLFLMKWFGRNIFLIGLYVCLILCLVIRLVFCSVRQIFLFSMWFLFELVEQKLLNDMLKLLKLCLCLVYMWLISCFGVRFFFFVCSMIGVLCVLLVLMQQILWLCICSVCIQMLVWMYLIRWLMWICLLVQGSVDVMRIWWLFCGVVVCMEVRLDVDIGFGEEQWEK